MHKEEIINRFKNGLIVSCQMEKHAPCYSDDMVELMAKAAVWGGACGLRIEGIENIRNIKSKFDIPVIGLIKIFSDDTEVFMTPTMKEVDELVKLETDIIAIDGTRREINGRRGMDIIADIKKKYPSQLILADVRDEEEALECALLGADFVAPTFYRFKKDAKSTDLPDWEMFSRMCRLCKNKSYVIMEGKIWTPDDAIRALYYGALAVVVGSAITRPHLITRRFKDHMDGFPEKRSLFY